MENKILVFDKKCINKNAFHKYKQPTSIDKVEIRGAVLSKTDLYGNKGTFKYFIGYIRNDGITPLNIKLPEMNAFAKYFKDKYMSLLVHDKETLKE